MRNGVSSPKTNVRLRAATKRVSPPPSGGLDQARSYQLNPQHTGGQDADPLRFPLAKLWSATAGLVLDTATGAQLGVFRSTEPPAPNVPTWPPAAPPST